jgi:formylglycine-generating enzyme required for sulfatase activity
MKNEKTNIVKDDKANSYRVERGGSWLRSASCARVSYRGSDYPSNRHFLLGFRLVLQKKKK